MSNPAQHLSDALMTTLDDLYIAIDQLVTRVEDLESERREPARQQWYDRREAAEYLRCHPATIDDMASNGRLVKHMLGTKPLYARDDLDGLPLLDAPVRLAS